MLRYIVILLFILFAFVQYNDPDPLIWILIYSSVALHVYAYDKMWYPSYARKSLLIILLVGIAIYVPDVVSWIKSGLPNIAGTMKANSTYVELVREGLGLLICFITVLIYKNS